MKLSFAPVVDARTRVLLLGSLPGEASLARGQYYANPRNQVWRLVEAASGLAVPIDYEARLEALRGAGIGLWDVVKSATRQGSLDAAIRDHRPNALDDLIADMPSLKAVGFNGATAARIGRASLAPNAGMTLIDLPSSSPAYTAPFAQKAEQWRRLRPFLTPD
jgi:TDG/mug DNA glycosylase family protein